MAIPLTAALLILPAIFGLLAPTSLADNHLLSGKSLYDGDSLKQGRYELIMQTDCDLVLYDNQTRVWATNTGHGYRPCRLELQKNGSLVIFDSNGHDHVWDFKSGKDDGDYILVVQHNGKVVIYGEQIFVKPPDPHGSLTAGHVLNENGEVINRKIAMVVNK